MHFIQSAVGSVATRLTNVAQQFNSATFYTLAGLAYQLASQKKNANLNLCRAVELAPSSLLTLRLYAQTEKLLWQAFERIEEQKIHFQNNYKYWFVLGKLQLAMYRLSDARYSFERALALNKSSAKTWWLFGWVLQQLKEQSASLYAYEQARKSSWHPNVKRFGVGYWFAQSRNWMQAVHAYTGLLEASQPNTKTKLIAQLLRRRAYVYQRLLDWDRASRDYQQALQLKPSNSLFEPLAWALAQSDQWQQVETVCQQALQNIPKIFVAKRKRIRKLLALSLSQNQPRQAIEQFQHCYSTTAWWQRYFLLHPKLLSLNNPQHRLHAQLAYNYVHQAGRAWTQQDWHRMIENLEQAIKRWPDHEPRLYAALGEAFACVGKWKAASQTFCQINLFLWPSSQQLHQRTKKQTQRLVLEYAEHRERLPIQPQLILYESYVGGYVSCNPYAIYQTMVKDPQFANWTHVWVLSDLKRAPEDCLQRDNVILVPRNSQLYQRYLATAKWLINNNTFPGYFNRRTDQFYLNTWHGTPFKTLGRDIRGFMEHKGAARTFLHATHMLSPNAHTSHVLIKRYDIDGLFQGQLLERGYPRNDLLINATKQQKQCFRHKLGLPETSKPVVLYAPTWRGTLGHLDVESQRIITDLQILQQQQNCQIVFRGHHLTEQALLTAGLGNVHIAPQAVDTAQVLAITDILITDYSSISFDFLLTERPILFYTHDLEDYQNQRGLYFDMHEMPGPQYASIEQLCIGLTQTLEQISQDQWLPTTQYRKAKERFCPHDDGQVTQRAIEFFFKDNCQNVLPATQDARQTLLFYAGSLITNGITTAFINLIKTIDPQRYRIVIAIEVTAVGKNPECIQRLQHLPEYVQIIGRSGSQLLNTYERTAIGNFNRYHTLNPEQKYHYVRAFKREFHRLFADWQPDYVIQYEGYSRMWAGILGCGAPAATQRIIYLHNDMHGEWQTRHPYLAAIFWLYRYFNRLVSVSNAINQVNEDQLAQCFELAKECFVYAHNVPDFTDVQARAKESLEQDFATWLAQTPPRQTFISIGRLSPEKNHALLLNAFAQLVKKYPQARLIILGEGPLRSALEQQIVQLHISHAVLLPGIRNNPFPLLSRSDCFVLPSAYEGLGMVLLEAMALNKPIIATDIPPVRELLAPGYGYLIEPSVDELTAAMEKIITGAGQLDMIQMDQIAYKNQAMTQFYALLEPHLKEAIQ